jgi:hypothetical protein
MLLENRLKLEKTFSFSLLFLPSLLGVFPPLAAHLARPPFSRGPLVPPPLLGRLAGSRSSSASWRGLAEPPPPRGPAAPNSLPRSPRARACWAVAQPPPPPCVGPACKPRSRPCSSLPRRPLSSLLCGSLLSPPNRSQPPRSLPARVVFVLVVSLPPSPSSPIPPPPLAPRPARRLARGCSRGLPATARRGPLAAARHGRLDADPWPARGPCPGSTLARPRLGAPMAHGASTPAWRLGAARPRPPSRRGRPWRGPSSAPRGALARPGVLGLCKTQN